MLAKLTTIAKLGFVIQQMTRTGLVKKQAKSIIWKSTEKLQANLFLLMKNNLKQHISFTQVSKPAYEIPVKSIITCFHIC